MLGKDSASLKNGTIAGVQALSGTGALRVLFNFIKNNMYKQGFNVWVSKPTWGNHNKVIWKSGLAKSKKDTMKYNYLDATQTKFDLEGMKNDLSKAQAGDVVLLHGCAHNPSGVDPKPEEWKQIAAFMKEKKLVPFFDCAYQGFATGDLQKDAVKFIYFFMKMLIYIYKYKQFAVQLFEKEGFEFLLAQSFAKNLGLYCERAGCASVITKSVQAKNNVFSQLCAVVRPMYSNPPAWGARIVKEVLGNEQNMKLWQEELNLMSGRIAEMRKLLRKNLEDLETPSPSGKLGDKCDKENSWRHITDQIGMFSYTGVTGKNKVVDIIRNKYHVYMLENGRISMAGINPKNVDRVAKALNAAIVGLNDKNKVDGRD